MFPSSPCPPSSACSRSHSRTPSPRRSTSSTHRSHAHVSLLSPWRLHRSRPQPRMRVTTTHVTSPSLPQENLARTTSSYTRLRSGFAVPRPGSKVWALSSCRGKREVLVSESVLYPSEKTSDTTLSSSPLATSGHPFHWDPCRIARSPPISVALQREPSADNIPSITASSAAASFMYCTSA